MAKTPSNSEILAEVREVKRVQADQGEKIKDMSKSIDTLEEYVVGQKAIDAYRNVFSTKRGTNGGGDTSKQMVKDILKITGWLAAALLLALQALNK